MIDETHDPALRSWVAAANDPACDFPIQNLPFGVFRSRAGGGGRWRCGVAIGDAILDLAAAAGQLGVAGAGPELLAAANLNPLMAAGAPVRRALRLALSRMLREGAAEAAALSAHLVPMAAADMGLPAAIGDYTDFYASIHHATNVGRMLRPDNPLLANYRWMPIAYHGRASSIGVSGQAFHRPKGQVKSADHPAPAMQATRRLDYELEVGVFVGAGNAPGEPIPVAEAEDRLFGLCLLNDWSARDIQGWEYQPLGPFLGKNFATTISPWVVTLEALAPFRARWQRPAGEPPPLAYLDAPALYACGAFDITLEAWIAPAGQPPVRLSRTGMARAAYWTVAQMAAHHTVNGCDLRPGDLFATGTMSGPGAGEEGSLLELTQGGRRPVDLGGGISRRFLEDGDTVILTASAERPGFRRIGFGECRGTVLPAR